MGDTKPNERCDAPSCRWCAEHWRETAERDALLVEVQAMRDMRDWVAELVPGCPHFDDDADLRDFVSEALQRQDAAARESGRAAAGGAPQAPDERPMALFHRAWGAAKAPGYDKGAWTAAHSALVYASPPVSRDASTPQGADPAYKGKHCVVCGVQSLGDDVCSRECDNLDMLAGRPRPAKALGAPQGAPATAVTYWPSTPDASECEGCGDPFERYDQVRAVAWKHAKCPPDDDNGTHGGAPHVHRGYEAGMRRAAEIVEGMSAAAYGNASAAVFGASQYLRRKLRPAQGAPQGVEPAWGVPDISHPCDHWNSGERCRRAMGHEQPHAGRRDGSLMWRDRATDHRGTAALGAPQGAAPDEYITVNGVKVNQATLTEIRIKEAGRAWAALLPGDQVTAPLGLGTVESDDGITTVVVYPDGTRAGHARTTIGLRAPHEHTEDRGVSEAIAAERRKIASWLTHGPVLDRLSEEEASILAIAAGFVEDGAYE